MRLPLKEEAAIAYLPDRPTWGPLKQRGPGDEQGKEGANQGKHMSFLASARQRRLPFHHAPNAIQVRAFLATLQSRLPSASSTGLTVLVSDYPTPVERVAMPFFHFYYYYFFGRVTTSILLLYFPFGS